MYAIGCIDTGGFIYARLYGDKEMMHRETRVANGDLPFATLDEAKEVLAEDRGECNPEFLLQYADNGGIESLWCLEASEEVIRTRLKIWSGCYGAWRVRRLNETVPTV